MPHSRPLTVADFFPLTPKKIEEINAAHRTYNSNFDRLAECDPKEFDELNELHLRYGDVHKCIIDKNDQSLAKILLLDANKLSHDLDNVVGRVIDNTKELKSLNTRVHTLVIRQKLLSDNIKELKLTALGSTRFCTQLSEIPDEYLDAIFAISNVRARILDPQERVALQEKNDLDLKEAQTEQGIITALAGYGNELAKQLHDALQIKINALFPPNKALQDFLIAQGVFSKDKKSLRDNLFSKDYQEKIEAVRDALESNYWFSIIKKFFLWLALRDIDCAPSWSDLDAIVRCANTSLSTEKQLSETSYSKAENLFEASMSPDLPPDLRLDDGQTDASHVKTLRAERKEAKNPLPEPPMFASKHRKHYWGPYVAGRIDELESRIKTDAHGAGAPFRQSRLPDLNNSAFEDSPSRVALPQRP